MGRLAGWAASLAGLFALPCAAAAAGALHEVARFEANGLEGLAQAADGSWILADATAHVFWRVDATGAVQRFGTPDAVPLTIIPFGDGWAATAQSREPDRASFAKAGPTREAFAHLGAQVLLLDAQGRVTRRIAGPDGSFFNGMDRLGDALLVADSTAGTIWRVDARKGTVRPWLRDPLLEGEGGRFPGANGLRVVGDTVYVANSTRNAIYRVGVDAHGHAAGPPSAVATVAGPDDFDVDAHGTIFLPSTDRLLAVPPSGSPSVLGEGCTGCNSARLAHDGHTLLVVTHGFGPDPGAGRLYSIDTSQGNTMANPLGLKAHHITARVRDIGRAIAWYRDVLGLELADQGERLGGQMKFASLRLPGYAISLVQLQAPATEVQSGQALLPTWIHPVFSVPDADALYRRFKAAGQRVAVHGPEPATVTSFLAYDPDGNELEFVVDGTP